MLDSNAEKPTKVSKVKPMPPSMNAGQGDHAPARIATPVRMGVRTTGGSTAGRQQNGRQTAADKTGGQTVTTRIAMRDSVTAGTTTI